MSEAITNELTDLDLSQVVGGSSTSVTTQLSASTASTLLDTMPIGALKLAPAKAATEAGTLYTAVVALAERANVPLEVVIGDIDKGLFVANMTTTTDGANTSYSCTLQANPPAQTFSGAAAAAASTQAAQVGPGTT